MLQSHEPEMQSKRESMSINEQSRDPASTASNEIEGAASCTVAAMLLGLPCYVFAAVLHCSGTTGCAHG